MTALRQRMLEDLQIRNYAQRPSGDTFYRSRSSPSILAKSPDQLGAEHIRAYQLFLVKEGRLSQSTYIQVVSALRFLYTQTLNRQVSIERIPFPRRERKLPIIMSREEVKALLEAPRGLRHARCSPPCMPPDQGLRGRQTQSWRHRQRPPRAMDTRRQRPQRPPNPAASQASGVAAVLLGGGHARASGCFPAGNPTGPSP